MARTVNEPRRCIAQKRYGLEKAAAWWTKKYKRHNESKRFCMGDRADSASCTPAPALANSRGVTLPSTVNDQSLAAQLAVPTLHTTLLHTHL